MMSKLVIIDGMDNTGKSTLIKRLTNVLELLGHTVTTIHSEKPPKDIKLEDTANYLHNYYFNLIKQILKLKSENKYEYIILDRGWISEYVYGLMYRGRDGKEIIEDNIVLDINVNSMFTMMSNNVYLFVLVASNTFLKSNDDSKSLSECDELLLDKERKLFEDGFNYSLLKNKDRYYVNDDNNNFVELLPIISETLIFS